MPASPADYQPRFTTKQACKAAGIAAGTFKNWVARRPAAIFLTEAERGDAGRGRALLLSSVRIVHIGLTGELVALGFQPRPAAMAAAVFSDMSTDDAAGTLADDDDLLPPGMRMPGQLFEHGLTYLVVPRGSTGDSRSAARCINVTGATTAADLFTGTGAASLAVVDVTAVHRRVRSVLGA